MEASPGIESSKNYDLLVPGNWSIDALMDRLAHEPPHYVDLNSLRVTDGDAKRISSFLETNYTIKRIKFNTESQQLISFDTETAIKRLLARNNTAPIQPPPSARQLQPSVITAWLVANPSTVAQRIPNMQSSQLQEAQRLLDERGVPAIIRVCDADSSLWLVANPSDLPRALEQLSNSTTKPTFSVFNQPSQSNLPTGGGFSNAIDFFELVKAEFATQPHFYLRFLDIMQKVNSQSIDTPTVISLVSELFKGHSTLLRGFNDLLPPGHSIAQTETASPAKLSPFFSSAQPIPVSTRAPLISKKRVFPVDAYAGVTSDTHRILKEGEDLWCCMLNQTNIGQNNNKFFLIQLLVEHDNPNRCMVFCRWGRVGEPGQSKREPFLTLGAAKRQLEKKFLEKTANAWTARKQFQPRPGKYTMIEMDFSDDEEEMVVENQMNRLSVSDTKLDVRVHDLITCIFDVKAMEAALTEMDFDLKKLPLHKLSKNQIATGYRCLGDLLRLIESSTEPQQKTDEGVQNETCKFYTLIPHNFGRSRPPMIISREALCSRMALVQCLEHIECAVGMQRLASEHSASPLALIDRLYHALRCNITVLDKTSRLFAQLATYVQLGHLPVHSGPAKQSEVLEVFDVEQEGAADPSIGNRKLLWYGTRITSVAAILSKGLSLPPPNAPQTLSRFGNGFYFYDVFSAAQRYVCASPSSSPVFLMMLFDVALGKQFECVRDQPNLQQAPAGYDSTLGVGICEPNASGNVLLDERNQLVVPLGQVTKTDREGVSCLHHEYVIYNVAQARLRYLVKCRLQNE